MNIKYQKELEALGNRYKTDKMHHHKYHIQYGSHFSHLKDYQPQEPLYLMEIGVSGGESLKMWKSFFPNSQIVGIDIDPKTNLFKDDLRIDVFIGDQGDNYFIQDVCQKYPNFDIVIDDGSHIVEDQKKTFQSLWPHLKNGGWYVIEDLDSNNTNTYRAIEKYIQNSTLLMTEIIGNYCNLLCLNTKEEDFEISEIHAYPKIAFIRKAPFRKCKFLAKLKLL